MFPFIEKFVWLVVVCVGSISVSDSLLGQQQPNSALELGQLVDRINSLETELQSMRDQMASGADVGASQGAAAFQSATEDSQGNAGQICGGCGRCFSCLCPLEPAPCIDCPRVSTLSPNFNIQFFGALKLDLLFSDPGVVAFGTPFFLIPDSGVGFAQSTLNINAR